ncbi:MAG: xanthine dehydrogenase family protein subunit M [Hyphomicrobiales bacterium]|nr:xanthine dehydrogenase family protein subunit M [Hyphomicrobiales bacterium]
MYDFNYHRPAKAAEATALIKKHRDGTLMSGGMTLIPTMKQRLASPSDVIDLSGLGNNAIKAMKTKITIGAGTTHAEVATNRDVKKAIPALAALAGGIGDPHVRHKGTLGGSIANNDPAADYPAGLVALDATVITTKRKLPADRFFRGMFETALARDEIVTAVEFPVPKRAGYAKFPNPASRYAMVGVFVADHGKEIRVAVTGAGASVFRHKAMEKALGKSFRPETAESIATNADGLNEDIHASADYRAHLVGIMAKRAVASAK